MLNTTTAFDTANELKNKQPVWVIEFDGIATKFSSGEFSGITSSYKKYLKSLNIGTAKIDLFKLHTDFFGFTFDIIEDSALTVLGIVSANSLAQIKVTAKIGYQSLVIGDFMEYPSCLLDKVTYNENKNTWTFSCLFEYNKLKKPIFQGLGITELTADAAVGAVTFSVTSTASFYSNGNAPWNRLGQTAVQVDNEIAYYTNETATSFTVGTVPFIRFGEQKGHSNGTTVYECMFLENDPAVILLNILTTTSTGSNGNYDLGLPLWGAGIDVDTIDTNQILNEIGYYGKWGMTGDWLIKPENGIDDALKWIEERFLPTLPGVLYLTNELKLGISVYDVIGNNEGDTTIDQDSILGTPSINSMEKNIVTHINISDTAADRGASGTPDGLNDEYQLDLVDAEYGEVRRLLIKMSSSQQYFTNTLKENIVQRYFGRLGSPIGSYNVETFLKHQNIQIADAINITHDKMLSFRNGVRGITTEGCQVVNVRTKYQNGKISPKIELENIFNSETVDFQDVNIVQQSSIDDTGLTKDANHLESTLQAADAYYDNTTYTATDIMVEMELTEPGNPVGINNRYITIHLKIQNPAGTDIEDRVCRFYYDEWTSTTRTAQFYVQNLPAAVYARVRVDWTATSGGTEPTNVTLKRIKFWHFKSTITKTGI